MENKRKHLDIIQGVINRLSHDSFQIKGWSVLLVSSLFALSTTQSDHNLVLLCYFPVIAFWILDGYYLWQERLYRALYDIVRIKEEKEIDYSMDTRAILNSAGGWSGALISKTLLIFHGLLLLSVLIVMILLVCS